MEPTTTRTSSANSREFVLVIVMLGILTLLVFFIVFSPIPFSPLPYKDAKGVIDPAAYQNYLNDSKTYFQDSLEYKRNLLAIILTAFGAWVGAGAAYFFGRENLRESANSLLQLHKQMTGGDKLGLIEVRDIPPKPLNSNFDESITIEDIIKKLEADSKLWFLAIKTSNEWSIISKEAIYIYIKKELEALSKVDENKTKPYNEINLTVMKRTLKDIVPELKKDDEIKSYVDKYVSVKLDDNAAKVNVRMDTEGVFLGIIKDDAGNLVQYFTTSDIRKALVKI